MYYNYGFSSNENQFVYSPYQFVPYAQPSFYDYNRAYPTNSYVGDRQQTIRGEATWTAGGPITECGIPWSDNEYMTVAVGENTPYQCGQTLKVRNLTLPGGREVMVTVVDRVRGYPVNKINLSRKAFEALGANPNIGVIHVDITPHPQLEQEKWGKFFLEIIQTAYPSYQVIDYNSIEKNQVSTTETKEVYEFDLQSSQGRIKVRGTVVYNPTTDRINSFDIKEV